MRKRRSVEAKVTLIESQDKLKSYEKRSGVAKHNGGALLSTNDMSGFYLIQEMQPDVKYAAAATQRFCVCYIT